ncbi:MAG: SpoIIE family protein phosphatase [Candidatus Heimdallarchaeota archaeon]|nr:SpoIIE family protein phosphatase [Candidatus Heimdallarchaeota archaeon]
MLSSISSTVKNEIELKYIRDELRQYCIRLGFKNDTIRDIISSFDELVINVFKHTFSTVVIDIKPWLYEKQINGIEIKVKDNGVGIKDIQKIINFEEEGNIENITGINYVMNHSSQLIISPNPYIDENTPSGLQIIFKKSFKSDFNKSRPKRSSKNKFKLEYYSKSHPKKGESYNGDAIFIRDRKEEFVVAVIDGLGHGEKASTSSKEAVNILRQHKTVTFENIINKLHNHLTKFVGCQMFLAKIDKINDIIKYVSIGNVQGYLLSKDDNIALPTKRGVIGQNIPKIKEKKYQIRNDCIMIIHTDGISKSWERQYDFDALVKMTPLSIVEGIHGKYIHDYDDSSIIVVKYLSYIK